MDTYVYKGALLYRKDHRVYAPHKEFTTQATSLPQAVNNILHQAHKEAGFEKRLLRLSSKGTIYHHRRKPAEYVQLSFTFED